MRRYGSLIKINLSGHRYLQHFHGSVEAIQNILADAGEVVMGQVEIAEVGQVFQVGLGQ